jgi:hypothetical protein
LLAPIPVYTRYLNTITRENNGRVYFSGGVNEYLNPESGKGEELTNHVFNQPQIDYIEREGVNVRYSNLIIHPDDSIQTVKKKIMEFGVQSVTYDEIYMFMKTHKPIRIEDIVGMTEISSTLRNY